jgi:hypothetical protein
LDSIRADTRSVTPDKRMLMATRSSSMIIESSENQWSSETCCVSSRSRLESNRVESGFPGSSTSGSATSPSRSRGAGITALVAWRVERAMGDAWLPLRSCECGPNALANDSWVTACRIPMRTKPTAAIADSSLRNRIYMIPRPPSCNINGWLRRCKRWLRAVHVRHQARLRLLAANFYT